MVQAAVSHTVVSEKIMAMCSARVPVKQCGSHKEDRYQARINDLLGFWWFLTGLVPVLLRHAQSSALAHVGAGPGRDVDMMSKTSVQEQLQTYRLTTFSS